MDNNVSTVYPPCKRGTNTGFIAAYLHKHGATRASTVLRALMAYRGIQLGCTTSVSSIGQGYFYCDSIGTRPRRGLQFGGVYTSEPPYSPRTSGCSPYWYQVSRHGPWALTPLGAAHAQQVVASGLIDPDLV